MKNIMMIIQNKIYWAWYWIQISNHVNYTSNLLSKTWDFYQLVEISYFKRPNFSVTGSLFQVFSIKFDV